MVDGFPVRTTDPDYHIQLHIDAMLQGGGEPDHAGAELLAPLLRRLAWHRARGDSSAVWQRTLRLILAEVVEPLGSMSDGEFDVLKRDLQPYERTIRAFTTAIENGPIHAQTAAALDKLRRVTDRPPVTDPPPTEFRTLLQCVTAAAGSCHGCWSERVRLDLDSLAPKIRADWMTAIENGFNRSNDYTARPNRHTLSALRRLGRAHVEGRLHRWIGMLAESASPKLTDAGAVLFEKVVALCHLLGGAASNELLLDIAGVHWAQTPAQGWLDAYLWALGRRSPDFAFACLEALIMNPYTAVEKVQQQYHGLLSTLGAHGNGNPPVGIDGFPLDSDPDLAPQQRRIDQLLRMASTAAASGPYVDPRLSSAAARGWLEHIAHSLSSFQVSPEVQAAHEMIEAAILTEFSSDPAALYRAAAIRVEWIAANEAQYPSDTLKLWNEWLKGGGVDYGLLARVFSNIDELPLEWLVRACNSRDATLNVMPLCEKHVAKHGWSRELVHAFRQWVPSIGAASTDLTFRQRAEWFLWFEDVAPIDPEICWSYRVKSDLRQMPPVQAAAWRALLDNNVYMVTGKPTVKWRKAAEAAFPKLGVAAFRQHFVAWFDPFAKAEPLRLTLPGRDVLRILMWCALIAKDKVVDQALLGFANVQWKTKQVEKRAALVEMVFQYVLSERMPGIALPAAIG